MVITKLSLTLLPGGNMVSKQLSESNPEEYTEEHQTVIHNYKAKKNKKLETLTFRTRKSISARQVLEMSLEAYKAMLEEPTELKYSKVVAKAKGKAIRVWDTMSEDIRIKKHCELIAHDLGAIDFSYNIFND